MKVVKLENEVVIEIVVGMVHESYKGFKKKSSHIPILIVKFQLLVIAIRWGASQVFKKKFAMSQFGWLITQKDWNYGDSLK